MNVCLRPDFKDPDRGEGGIRRVVEAQKKYLPNYGITLVDDPRNASVLALHAGNWTEPYDARVVTHCHGLYWDDYEWPKAYDRINRMVVDNMRRSDAVTGPTEWVAKIIRRGMLIDAQVIPHGVNVEDWTPVVEHQPFVLWNKSRVDLICDVDPLNHLVKAEPNIEFISTFGTPSPNLKVTGTVPFVEAKQYIQNASVYLSNSRETFGIGTLEAMVSEVPVLAWAWGGNVDLVQHKVTGYLCNPGDFDGLVQGLHYCLDHREELGHNAREVVLNKYQWEPIIGQYADLYKRVAVRPGVRVSIIVRCHNDGQYLPDALNSILNQTYTNYEIIIVDDASTDERTLEVAREFAHQHGRITLIELQENVKLAQAANVGVEASNGEYIMLLDADNMLGPDILGFLAGQLDTHRELDIVYGAMEVIEPDGKRFIAGWPRQFDYAQQMSNRNQCHSSSLYRKRLWNRVGGYRTRCKTAEDADFWCRATSYGGKAAKVTDAITLIYRNREGSVSHSHKDWQWSGWYSWGTNKNLVPFGADTTERLIVPTYEPTLVSVIIPVGPGHERYLPDALDSLISQTFVKWECIVVNDTGNYLPVPPFVRLLTTGYSGGVGQSKARNIGLDAAQGRAIVFLDADDYLRPTALERMYEEWSQDPSMYIYSDWILEETGETKETSEYRCGDVLQVMPHAITAMYPKSTIRFDESLIALEDWDYVIANNVDGHCGLRIPDALVTCRMSTGLVSHTDEIKASIQDKWKSYITKELEMPCGGCGGSRRVLPRGNPQAAQQASKTSGDLVLVEYTGQINRITFRGNRTQNLYRFGTDPEHRYKYVAYDDAPNLLSRNDFKPAKVVDELIAAT